MRKFKFRIWDGNRNKFYYTHEKDSIYYNIGLAVDCVNGFFHRLEQVQEDENLVLQQYTGAVDQNGVEIYEGDIVRLDTGCFYDFERIASVYWDEEDVSFFYRWSTKYLGERKEILHNGRDCTVIGNIFLDNDHQSGYNAKDASTPLSPEQ